MTFDLYVMNATNRNLDIASSIEDIVLRQNVVLPAKSQAHLIFSSLESCQKAHDHYDRCGIWCASTPSYGAPIVGPIVIRELNDVVAGRDRRIAQG